MSSTKQIVARQSGNTASLGPDLTIRRLLPSAGFFDLNPFIMLDELVPRVHIAHPDGTPQGTGAHPHRGFTTFTYLLSGELEHEDSFGHKAIVGSGEAQVMLAGSGIVHNERPSKAFFQTGGTMHGFQLWINLPAEHKSHPPSYQSLRREDIPSIHLSSKCSVHVLLGTYGHQSSPIHLYWPLQILRLDLLQDGEMEWEVNPGWESWMFLPTDSCMRVGNEAQTGASIIRFASEGSRVTLQYEPGSRNTAFLFQAPFLKEPIAAHGPFVMNHQSELMEAYSAFHRGDYGRL